MPSRLIINSAAGFAKAMLTLGCKNVEIRGLDSFLQILNDKTRREHGRGLITYCNHISVMDEPTIWGSLPWKTFQNADTTRWTLGASDIMFTNKYVSKFFELGQVIKTHRGGGIFQPAIDLAISKLGKGQWIHLFPEGFVNVSTTTDLRRFKWGISRMIMEAEALPIIVPMWISGFDRIMPEPRPSPKFVPRFGANVTITFGDPIDTQLSPLLNEFQQKGSISSTLLPADLDPIPSLIQVAKSCFPLPQTPSSSSSSSSTTAPPSSLSAIQSESIQRATARSQIAELLRYQLTLLGRNVRKLSCENELTGSLCHTASLIQNTENISDQHTRHQLEQGKKDSPT